MTDRRKAWLLKAMMLTASASVLAACQTTSPYVERRAAEQTPPPAYTPPAYTPPPQVALEPAAPAAAPSGSISSAPLPAPTYAPPTYTPPAYTPPPPPPPAPVTRPATPAEYRTVTTGRVVDADGPPKVYTVKSGDALDAIAKDMGLSRKELADLNNLKSPYPLKPGQKLTGPKSRAKAYTVGSGDTLSAIGRRFSVTAQAIADANDMERSDSIRPGQRLVLPDGYKDLGAQRVLVTPAVPASSYTPAPTSSYTPYTPPAPAPAPVAPPRPSTSVYDRPSPPPAPVYAPPAAPALRPAAPASTPAASTDSQIQALGRGQFIWPLRGRQLSGFGARGAMARSNGLNIAAPAGTTVRASATGKVIYAGSQLSDYGNLVLIQHANGFVSVYAHLSRILVQNQADVRQNQEIGEVGQTGGVTEPQLYFEMRFAARESDKREAFDPMLVLPRQ